MSRLSPTSSPARSRRFTLCFGWALCLACALQSSHVLGEEVAKNTPNAPGLGDPGKLEALQVSSGRPDGTLAVLRGRDAQQQLVVSGKFSTGQQRDLTRMVSYAIAPQGIVSIDSSGLLLPLGEGKATVTATSADGVKGTLEVAVEKYVDEALVNFPNQIVPIFTKLGCNTGGCHGKASGQNGFKLSLLGFEPGEDGRKR